MSQIEPNFLRTCLKEEMILQPHINGCLLLSMCQEKVIEPMLRPRGQDMKA